MATPSTTGLRWATAACGHPLQPASDAQSAALGEHLRHCRTRFGRILTKAPVSSASVPAQPRHLHLVALLARAARLIR